MKKRAVPNQMRWGVLIVGLVVVVAGVSPRSSTTSQVHRKTLGVAEETPAATQAVVDSKSEDAVQLNADAEDCSTGCGEGQSCVNGRCVCAMGHGGPSCGFSIQDIYHTDYKTLYDGMRENPEYFRPLDLQVRVLFLSDHCYCGIGSGSYISPFHAYCCRAGHRQQMCTRRSWKRWMQ